MIEADGAASRRKLRIALIVDSKMASKYVHDVAKWGQQQEQLEISHLIIQRTQPTFGKGFLGRMASAPRGALQRLVRRIESRKIRHDSNHKDHLAKFDLSEAVKGSICVELAASKSSFIQSYGERDLIEIRKLNFDVLIQCGSGILDAEVQRSARFGVIAMHHADDRIDSGGPPGFWEVYLKQDSTGFTIQQLTEEPDGGNVLFRGRLPTKGYWLLNQAALYAKSNYYLKKILLDIAKTGQIPVRLESFPYFNRQFKEPSARVLWSYLLTQCMHSMTKRLNDRFIKKHERWGVAFSRSDWRNLVMSRGIKIPNPPYHFLADPFVVRFENADYCFVEDYDCAIWRGYITVYKLLEKGSERIGEALVEPFHMSYPYIFEYQSKYYMCPETSANRDIRVYECVEFPLKWKLKQVLMSDVSAADTTIFEKDGVWWLLTNIDSIGVGDHCSELSLFFADHPLSDQWTPHPKNPIFVDSLRARNGGILYERDSIYRVSQLQAFDRYGAASCINRITRLSKTEYREEPLFPVEANFFEDLIGTHHIHSNGKVTVFDFLKKSKADSWMD